MLILKTDTNGVTPLIKTGEELHDYLRENSSAKGELQEELTIVKTGIIVKSGDTISWVMSDGSIDRDDEIINSSGWLLENFKANPLLLWSHNRSIPAIGKVDNPRVIDNSLKGDMFFNPKEIDEFGWAIGQRAKIGTLNAGSVGFQPLEWKWIEDKNNPADLEFVRQDLHEFSICNVPSNPFALSEGKDFDPEKKEIVVPGTKEWNGFFEKSIVEEIGFDKFFNNSL